MSVFRRIINFFHSLFHREEKNVEPPVERPAQQQPTSIPEVVPYERVFHNVIFKDPFGNDTLTHEIDRIFVRRNGVFCIEDKDWAGVIYGDEFSKNWKQVLGDGFTVHMHPNPILQNEVHEDVLEKIISSEEERYHVIPVVVMQEDNSPLSYNEKVINKRDLREFLLTHSSFDPELSNDEFHELCQVIEDNDQSPYISREEHVRNIRRNHPEAFSGRD